MSKRLTGKFDQRQVDGIEALKSDEGLDSYSEAIRIASDAGLHKLGYVNGQKTDTALRMVARRFADAFAIVALLLTGMTFLYPLEFRMVVVAPFAASLSCYALDRGLKHYEPAVSNRLSSVFKRDRAGDRA